MKNYIVTHTFKSKEAKAKMIEVTGSMSMEDMTKAWQVIMQSVKWAGIHLETI